MAKEFGSGGRRRLLDELAKDDEDPIEQLGSDLLVEILRDPAPDGMLIAPSCNDARRQSGGRGRSNVLGTMVLQPSISESPFEHPAFGGLYLRTLRDVADRNLDERERKAAARALAFLLREQVVDERVATDVLTVLHRSLDVPKVVRTLLLGLVGVTAPEKIAEWTRAVADRALADGRLPSFISAMRILVELSGYDGTVPARWRISLLRAIEFRELASRVLCFCRDYVRRFPRESSGWWIQTARTRSTVAVLRRRVTVAEMREARLS